MSKQTYYFQHDNNAYSDEKIVELRMTHGMAGYGCYWAIIELLHQNEGKMELNTKRIAFTLSADEALVSSVINDFGLFEVNNNELLNKRLNKHFEKRKAISRKRSEAGKKGGRPSSKKANEKQMLNKRKASAKQKKAKERKGKEIKKKNTKKENQYENVIKQLSEKETNKFMKKYRISKEAVEDTWEMMVASRLSRNEPYDNWLLALHNWIKPRIQKGEIKQKKSVKEFYKETEGIEVV